MSPHREPGGRRANDAGSIDDTVAALRARLEAVATPEQAAQAKEYLKSDLVHLGATVPDARAAAKWLHKEFPEISSNPWALVDACWSAGVYELRSTMAFFLERATLGKKCLARLEALCRDAHTWALVDQLSIHVVSRAKPPHGIVMRWATDDDFWVRRMALLVHVKELRAGKGNPDAWAPIAVANLQHPEFFIRKAIGWVLRDIGKRRPEWTEDFIELHRHHMAPLSIEEATRHIDSPPA